MVLFGLRLRFWCGRFNRLTSRPHGRHNWVHALRCELGHLQLGIGGKHFRRRLRHRLACREGRLYRCHKRVNSPRRELRHLQLGISRECLRRRLRHRLDRGVRRLHWRHKRVHAPRRQLRHLDLSVGRHRFGLRLRHRLRRLWQRIRQLTGALQVLSQHLPYHRGQALLARFCKDSLHGRATNKAERVHRIYAATDPAMRADRHTQRCRNRHATAQRYTVQRHGCVAGGRTEEEVTLA